MQKKTEVLIVGGGFGGVKAALELSDDDNFRVTVLSDNQNMRYYPTLYHVATGGRRSNASIPLTDLFEGKKLKIVYGTAKTLDRKSKTITTDAGERFDYDVLVLALGVVTNYMGIKGLDTYSYSIKSQESVDKFKQHLHQQIYDSRVKRYHYVVVGGGPTGVELAGELPAYLAFIAKNHGLKLTNFHVDVVEAMPRLLPSMPKDVSRAVRRRLKHIGVNVCLKAFVQGESADTLTVNRQPIRSHTVVWTAGVSNHPFFNENSFTLTSRGKVSVNAYLETEPNIYVLGDNANTPYSGMAQTALRDGSFVASNIKRQQAGKTMKSYKVKRPVTVITVGPRWAVVIWGKLRFTGYIGWIMREASNAIGFHDLEPWSRSLPQWLSDFGQQESCEVCALSLQK